MASVTQSTRFSSWDTFDVDEYVERCYGAQVMDVDRALIEGVIDTMGELGLKPGCWRRAVDVGAGPNLFPAMLMAPFLADDGELDLLEPSAPNRQYLKETIEGIAARVPTWTKFEDLMRERSATWTGSLERARRLARVRPGDIFALPPETYDAVSAFFVTESITNSDEQCELAVAKLLAAVKPNGFVMVGHMLHSDGWYAGEGKYPAVPLSLSQLHEFYSEHLHSLRIIAPEVTPEVRHGYAGAAAVVGIKKHELSGAERVFTPYDIQNCLHDEKRVEHFQRAIEEVVRPGDVVVDGGSGTGVLGLLAAKQGAARVYCIELNREYAEVITENARINDLSDRIRVITGDAASVSLPEQVDVIISEVISGGLFYEPQLQIVGNLRRFLKPGGTVIPRSMTNDLELVHAQDELYGLKFSYDTRHRALAGDRSLTDAAAYLEVDFVESSELTVEAEVTLTARRSGEANALRVPYSLQFSPGEAGREATEFLLNPQIIFLPRPIVLREGGKYTVAIKYHSGDSPLNAAISVIAADETT